MKREGSDPVLARGHRTLTVIRKGGAIVTVGIGEHTPDRVLSLVIGGQQPYGWPDSPLVREDEVLEAVLRMLRAHS